MAFILGTWYLYLRALRLHTARYAVSVLVRRETGEGWNKGAGTRGLYQRQGHAAIHAQDVGRGRRSGAVNNNDNEDDNDSSVELESHLA